MGAICYLKHDDETAQRYREVLRMPSEGKYYRLVDEYANEHARDCVEFHDVLPFWWRFGLARPSFTKSNGGGSIFVFGCLEMISSQLL